MKPDFALAKSLFLTVTSQSVWVRVSGSIISEGEEMSAKSYITLGAFISVIWEIYMRRYRKRPQRILGWSDYFPYNPSFMNLKALNLGRIYIVDQFLLVLELRSRPHPVLSVWEEWVGFAAFTGPSSVSLVQRVRALQKAHIGLLVTCLSSTSPQVQGPPQLCTARRCLSSTGS